MEIYSLKQCIHSLNCLAILIVTNRIATKTSVFVIGRYICNGFLIRDADQRSMTIEAKI